LAGAIFCQLSPAPFHNPAAEQAGLSDRVSSEVDNLRDVEPIIVWHRHVTARYRSCCFT
jgi:hypothetical protein